ncbi:MAG: hypothetical protein E7648_03150 [Ruminococcaceae bacterium]|nr:hypothetical protein [Oscillospiraceae bacterium]
MSEKVNTMEVSDNDETAEYIDEYIDSIVSSELDELANMSYDEKTFDEEMELIRREEEERRRREAEAREKKMQEELAAKRARYKELNDAIALQMQIIRENKGWFGAKANTRKMAQKQLESLQIQLVREFPFGLKE